MTRPRILIYGATGYSGRLIAAEAAAQRDTGVDWVLASRDARALSRIAGKLELPWQAFALDDVTTVRQALAGFRVVINAAGPFANTGEPLARGAILAGCHYVDLNGEADVYKRLDDQGRDAALREVVLVSGAGQTATVSDLLLTHALRRLQAARACSSVGTVRVAVTRLTDFSRGSVQTMLRAVREQVTVAQRDTGPVPRLRLGHVPIGRLERSFDFSLPDDGPAERRFGPRIAAAANLIDTLVAKRSCELARCWPTSIESYVEMPTSWRLAYQWGAVTAPLYVLPGVQALARWQIGRLPEGPPADTRSENRHRVVLEIDSATQERLLDWRIDTPDPYDFSARSAVAVALRLMQPGAVEPGWQTPGRVLADVVPLPHPGGAMGTEHGPFRDCRFAAMRTPAAARAA